MACDVYWSARNRNSGMQEATRDLKFKSFLESMDISTKDIWTLFMLLGLVAVAMKGVGDDFPDGLIKSKG